MKWLTGPMVSNAYTKSTHISVVAWKAPSYINLGLKTPHIMRCLRWRDAANTVTIIWAQSRVCVCVREEH